MSIEDNLIQIRTAVYGAEVREALASGLEDCYNAASVQFDNTNMEVEYARGNNATLGERLDGFQNGIDSLSSGGPKGVYTTLSALQAAYPTGNSNIYVVTEDGKWYYWNSSAWVAGGIYQATGLTDKSVKAGYINTTYNMFDSTKTQDGKQITGYNVTTRLPELATRADQLVFEMALPSTGVISIPFSTNLVGQALMLLNADETTIINFTAANIQTHLSGWMVYNTTYFTIDVALLKQSYPGCAKLMFSFFMSQKNVINIDGTNVIGINEFKWLYVSDNIITTSKIVDYSVTYKKLKNPMAQIVPTSSGTFSDEYVFKVDLQAKTITVLTSFIAMANQINFTVNAQTLNIASVSGGEWACYVNTDTLAIGCANVYVDTIPTNHMILFYMYKNHISSLNKDLVKVINSNGLDITSQMANNSVTTHKLANQSVNPRKLSNDYNMLDINNAVMGQSLVGVDNGTVVFGTNTGVFTYTLDIPDQGLLRISTLDPTTGQFLILINNAQQAVYRFTYNEAIGGSYNPSYNLPESYFKYINNELVLDCTSLKANLNLSKIIIAVSINNIPNAYIYGERVISSNNYKWLSKISTQNYTLSNLNEILDMNSENIRLNSRLRGYDVTTKQAIRQYDTDLFTFKLDLTKYSNCMLYMNNSDTLKALTTVQRFIGYDVGGNAIYNSACSNYTLGYIKFNVAQFLAEHPTAITLEISFSISESASNYIYKKDIAPTNVKSINFEQFSDEYNLLSLDKITHSKKVIGYDLTTYALATGSSPDYFYATIDNPKCGQLKVAFTAATGLQTLVLMDDNGKCTKNFYSLSIATGSIAGITYVEGDDYITLDMSVISTTAAKLVFCFAYDKDAYIMGTGIVDINELSIFKQIETGLDSRVEIVTPAKFVVPQNREVFIHYNNIVRYFNTDKANIITCSNSEQNNDKFARFQKTNTTGVTSTISLYKDNTLASSISKPVQISISPADAGNGITKNVLFIGDSLTDAGVYAGEIANLFSTDVMHVNLLGTRGTGLGKHEGRAGWRAWEYVNLASGEFGYSGANAFYNPEISKFDFLYYMTTQGYGSVDYVFINLGTNDIARSHHTSDLDILDSYNYMINDIKQYNPNVKILLWLPPMRALGMLNTSKTYTDSALRMTKLLIDTYDNREAEHIYLVPVYFNIDPEHDYNYTSGPISSRNNKFTQLTCSDTVHCATEGYYKMADVIYSYIKYMASLEV